MQFTINETLYEIVKRSLGWQFETEGFRSRYIYFEQHDAQLAAMHYEETGEDREPEEQRQPWASELLFNALRPGTPMEQIERLNRVATACNGSAQVREE